MKSIRESFWDRLYNRLPANDAAIARRVLGRTVDQPIDYMTIKALSELVDAYKGSARAAIRAYRKWCLIESVHKVGAATRQREGEILRKAALDQAALYLDARRDYRDLFKLAMRSYEPADKTSAR